MGAIFRCPILCRQGRKTLKADRTPRLIQAKIGRVPITASIVKARNYTAEYVMIAKQSLAKNPSDLQQAQKLYGKRSKKRESAIETGSK